MYPTHIKPDNPATKPAGINFPLSCARLPITEAKIMQVARAKKVPTRYVGLPMNDADIKSITAMAEEIIRLVLLPFLKYAMRPAPEMKHKVEKRVRYEKCEVDQRFIEYNQ